MKTRQAVQGTIRTETHLVALNCKSHCHQNCHHLREEALTLLGLLPTYLVRCLGCLSPSLSAATAARVVRGPVFGTAVTNTERRRFARMFLRIPRCSGVFPYLGRVGWVVPFSHKLRHVVGALPALVFALSLLRILQ
jgi:hypothetical protein